MIFFWVHRSFWHSQSRCRSTNTPKMNVSESVRNNSRMKVHQKTIFWFKNRNFHIFHHFWFFVIFFWVHRSFWHPQSRCRSTNTPFLTVSENIELVRKKNYWKTPKMKQVRAKWKKHFFWRQKKCFWPREWPRPLSRSITE